jgi:hypothetical protein
MTAADLIIAFAEFFGARGSYVSVCKHGGSPGYVHIVPGGFDPARSRERHVAVELYNGTVCVTDALKDAIGAHLRPDAPIQKDPLGYSAGPKYGRFAWALALREVEAWKGGARGFVKEVSDALDELKGRAAGGQIGDYDE